MYLNFPIRVALSLALLSMFSISARAETPSQIPNPLQTRRAWVADEAHVVDVATEAKINGIIARLERRNGAEIAVVTVHNLGGLSVENFALRLFKLWGIGKKSLNNGVLVLAAIDDRKARIGVGLGLEKRIPDAKAASILQSQILSAFRRDDYGGGLLAGVVALDRVIRAPESRPKAKATAQPRVKPKPAVPFAASQSGSSSRPTSSQPTVVEGWFVGAPPTKTSGFGGALWLLLLGGGGVATIVYFASRPRRCAQCQGEMEELAAAAATQALTPVQRFEESIGSRDYHLWRCKKCGDQLVDVSNRLFNSYGDCRACGNRTASSQTGTEVHATESQAGRAIETHTCEWPQCGHIWQEERVLPRRSSSSSHRHSSSGSSKSGFGGGSSGGSGASGSW